MNESNPARAAWIALVQSLLAQLRRVVPFKTPIPSELAFRDEFFKLPEELNLPSGDRNWGVFLRYHGQIQYIVQTLDNALALKPPLSLCDVLWTYALIALQSVMQKDTEFKAVRTVYAKLNQAEDIPAVSSDLPQFPKNLKVQAPLQKIVKTYFDCYLVFVKQYEKADDREDVDQTPIFDEIDAAGPEYRDSEAEWRAQLQTAADDNEMANQMPNIFTAAMHIDPSFKHLRHLGEGAYGIVDEVELLSTGGVYARKSIPVTIDGHDPKIIEKRVRNEVEIMTKLRHNHIASVNMLFRNDKYWSLIMLPVAEYDLRVFLEEFCIKPRYPRDALRMMEPWFGCLISALAYSHVEMIKHEDIKPQNILIKGKKIFLTDFGTAKDFSELEKSTISDHFIAGTPVYWAPEDRPWGRPADIFALGCVFSEMLTVRQKRSLGDYRQYRYTPKAEFGYAYKSNLEAVRRWLTEELSGIDENDPVAQTILEQTLNMLMKDDQQRLEATRVKRLLRLEEALFCTTCG